MIEEKSDDKKEKKCDERILLSLCIHICYPFDWNHQNIN